MKNSNIITEKDAYIRSKRDKKPNKLIFDDLNEKYSVNSFEDNQRKKSKRKNAFSNEALKIKKNKKENNINFFSIHSSL